MDLTNYLLEEVRRHPSVTPQDITKLCHQVAFGAEHMISDFVQAHSYFMEEYEATSSDDRPLAEYIGPTTCRVNLSAWKRLGLNPSWLWELFIMSISYDPDNNYELYYNCTSQAGELAQAGRFPFSYAQWLEYKDYYGGLAGCPPVRHSEGYREKEKPAYRILTDLSVAVLPIIEKLGGLGKGVIAIDGRAAAGKSTMARYLACVLDIWDLSCIEMDDFFLPSEMRTAERLARPGGNIHHERFAEEVLPHLRSGQAFKYRKYDCTCMDYGCRLKINPHPWRIVEGVYSCHPALGDYMDVRVFLDVEPDEQQGRIEKRNNPQIAANYLSKWIPMEEAYFKAYNIRERADVVLSAN